MSQSPVPSYRILIVDDTPSIHDDFAKIFASTDATALDDLEEGFFGAAAKPVVKSYRFELSHTHQGEEAHELNLSAIAAGQPYAVAFVDMRMPPGWDGLETIRHLWNADPHLQIVICTAYSDHNWGSITAQLGLTDNLVVLRKPFDNIEVLQLAHAFASKWSLARQLQARIEELDRSARHNAAAYQTANKRFSAAFLESSTAYAIVSLGSKEILLANSAFNHLTGSEASEGLPFLKLPCWPEPNPLAATLARLLAGEHLGDVTMTLAVRDGPARSLRITGSTFVDEDRHCALLQFTDITEHLRLQQQLLHAQKMEAVGALSAGIAHDFNNLLTVIQGYTSTTLRSAALPAESRSELQHVAAAAERAAALTRQLLLFSRRQIAQPEPIDLGTTLNGLKQMLTRLLPERIKLEWPITASLPRVNADPSNIEQVVMNLVINAADAIPGPGTIEIKLDLAELGPEAAQRHSEARPGRFVSLSVRDTGTGMTNEVLAHIFDPFFTTKAIGKGTGLGLSTVYGIVRQHEGWIEVASAVGAGSTFRVLLPALPELPQPKSDEKPALDTANLNGRGEHILLVEDEPSVSLVTAAIITRSGYRVTATADAGEALKLWQEKKNDFSLVLTDIMMPNGMNGIELATRLRQDRPNIPLVFSTGYSKDLLRGAPEELRNVPILLKPYTHGSILSIIRGALDHRG